MSKTLLLADDSVTIQRVIELSFANEDVRVVSVGDGRRAVQWIDTEHPDIVVADVGVPDVDGYSIASHVKKSAALKHIPVVLLAGAFEPIDESRARIAGCDGILIKPFEPQQLVSRVKELLAESERFAPAKPQPAAAPSAVGPRPVPVPANGPRAIGAETEPPAASTPAEVRPFPAAGAPIRMVANVFETATAPPGTAVTDRLEVESLDRVDFSIAAGGERLEPPAAPVWNTSLGHTTDVPEVALGAPKVSLANAFSALLAAERSRPAAASVAVPEIPEAAIEEAVRRILARMTGETVRQIVLETAERLIREEIEKIKGANPE
jgi:CheY-like chemotaxis protein